jgi:hypothetical protein
MSLDTSLVKTEGRNSSIHGSRFPRVRRLQGLVPQHAGGLGLELNATAASKLPATRAAIPKARFRTGDAGDHREVGLHDEPAPQAFCDHVPLLGEHLGDRFALGPSFDDADAIRVSVAHVRVMFASRRALKP